MWEYPLIGALFLSVGAPSPVNAPVAFAVYGYCAQNTIWGGNPGGCTTQLNGAYPSGISGLVGSFAESRVWSRTLQAIEVAGAYSVPPPNVTPVKFAVVMPAVAAFGWGSSATFGVATAISFGTHPYLTPRITSSDATAVTYATLSPPANVPIDMSLWLVTATNPAGMLTFTLTASAFPNLGAASLSAANLVVSFDQSVDTTNFLPVAPFVFGPTYLQSTATWALVTTAASLHASFTAAPVAANGGVAFLNWMCVARGGPAHARACPRDLVEGSIRVMPMLIALAASVSVR
jgi:hypothetical protein